MLKITFLTSVWGAQHPNAGRNIQQFNWSFLNITPIAYKLKRHSIAVVYIIFCLAEFPQDGYCKTTKAFESWCDFLEWGKLYFWLFLSVFVGLSPLSFSLSFALFSLYLPFSLSLSLFFLSSSFSLYLLAVKFFSSFFYFFVFSFFFLSLSLFSRFVSFIFCIIGSFLRAAFLFHWRHSI